MGRGRRDRGGATAEIAVALPALVLVLATALAAVRLGIDHVRCVDASGTAARLLARGEAGEVARSRALAVAPEGARLVVAFGPDTVRVTVTAALPRELGWSGLPEPRAEAVAAVEGLP